MRLRGHAQQQQNGPQTAYHQARLKLTSLLEQAQAYADHLVSHQQSNDGFCQQQCAADRKRKRASPYIQGRNSGRAFEEQLSMPGTPTQDLLPLLRGELRHHQLQGVRWLMSLYMSGLNGILADELESDRRAQVIGLLSYFKSKGVWGPFLVACSHTSHAAWASDMADMLGAGTVVHVADGRPGSCDALPLLCAGSREGSACGRTDPPTPPTTIILTTLDVLLSRTTAFAALPFKYIAVDSSPPSPSATPPAARNSSSALAALDAPLSHPHVPPHPFLSAASSLPHPRTTPGGSTGSHVSQVCYAASTAPTTAPSTHASPFQAAGCGGGVAGSTSAHLQLQPPLMGSGGSGEVRGLSGVDLQAMFQHHHHHHHHHHNHADHLSRVASAPALLPQGSLPLPTALQEQPSLHTPLAPSPLQLKEAVVAAMKAIRAPSAGMVLLTSGNPLEGESLPGLCPLLSLVMPEAAPPILQALSELQAASVAVAEGQQRAGAGPRPPLPPQAGGGAQNMAQGAPVGDFRQGNQAHRHQPLPPQPHHQAEAEAGAGGWGDHQSVMEDTAQSVRGVVGRLVLGRTAGEVDLAVRRGRTTELNLYDLFASAQ